MRCPAGIGLYTTLTPRQELTAAPAALALTMPFNAEVGLTDPLISLWNTGSGDALQLRGTNGLWVESAAEDGVHVVQAGAAPTPAPSGYNNGIEVEAAQQYGLYLGATGASGLRIEQATANGVYVNAAGNDGIEIHSAGAYAGNFTGDICISGNCIGCALAQFARNAGATPLAPGDIVALWGMQPGALDNAAQVLAVVPAGEGAAAIGVVSSRAGLEAAGADETVAEGQTGRRLVPRAGAARPGEYLVVVVSGRMQVRVDAKTAASIGPGTRLAVGAGGLARPLKTMVLDGMTVPEGAPVLGVALDAPDADGLVWVLVSPRQERSAVSYQLSADG